MMAKKAGNFSTGIPLQLVVFFYLAAVHCNGLPATMTLERAFPMSRHVDLSQVIARDMDRHGRKLQSTTGGVTDFPVDGTSNPTIAGLYYTKVKLGTPPKEFYVDIDTGSDALWVGCGSCSGCPSSSSFNIPLSVFDPKSSSTSSGLPCSDQRCTEGIKSSEANCSAQTNLCSYSFEYADNSTTSGYYVSDTLHLDKILGGSETSNSSATIVFGCSTAVGGGLSNVQSAVDGIFGFGPQSLSVISQLASQGITPKVFSHCLKGDDAGGGILVLGEVVEPNMVYSPLVPSQSHYNLNLESISVNGQALDIDPSAFATSDNGGTIIDSGTTLAYLAEKAYYPFFTAIDSAATSRSAQPVLYQDLQCYTTTSSIDSTFPQVTLNFEGKASMTLGPQNYLLKLGSYGGNDAWCLGIVGVKGGLTLIGDIVLKDKIIVYDLAGQRIGWTNYDCSQSVNVSMTSTSGQTEIISVGPSNNTNNTNKGSSSSMALTERLTLWIAMIGIIYTSMLSTYIFL